jgi:peptidoglycan/LPS O-acetylase OafA/YrhL
VAGGKRFEFRTDIEGLRGVAVALVVLFHIGLTSVQGGYIGVDVFFVISGFLISRLLYDEARDRTSIRLAAFWARRVRRLVPALLVVVAATLMAGVVVYSPLAWKDLGRQATASVLYVSNIYFAQNGSAYFESATSPYLHTWSLGVEEQFYLAWPLLFLAVTRLGRRSPQHLARNLAVSLVAVSAVSFAVCVLLTDRGTPWAFYSAPTRAWEFGLGALAGIFIHRLRPRSTPTWSTLGWIGVALVVGSALRFGPHTLFPGPAALVPVLGSVLVIAAPSGAPWAATRCLSLGPVRYVGRVSYSFYLWHWPVIVLADARWGLGVRGKAVAALVAFVLAIASFHLVEDRVRFAAVVARPARAFAAGALVSLAVLGLAAGISWRASRELEDPYLAKLANARSARSTTGSANCTPVELPSGRTPCMYGDPESELTFVLVGDSHAAQWSPAVESVASDMDARLVVRSRGGCPAPDLFIAPLTGAQRASSACLAFRKQTRALIDELDPDLVVLANTRYNDRMLRTRTGGLLHDDDAARASIAATAQYAGTLTESGTVVAVIQDNPSVRVDPIECLAKRRSIESCSPRSSDVLPPLRAHTTAEADALRAVGVTAILDSGDLVCDDDRCWVERDGTIVYADSNHLSRAFVEQQEPLLQSFLTEALGTATT